MPEEIHKILIIGSGPAGLTAAIYAARAELNPVVIAGSQPGGQLMFTTDVENFPGFPEGIMGPDLMQKMIKQAERFGAKLIYEQAKEANLGSHPFTIKTDSQEFKSQTLIIASGADAKWLGLESEERLKGKGVSSCATCDGAFFKDKKVFVVGGGDSAMEEATFLTRFASSVTILVRKDELKASKIMQERAQNNKKIEWLFNTEVQEVVGEEKVTGLKLLNNKTEETSEVQADGLFVAIGHKPNTEIFKGSLDTDEIGYLKRQPYSAKSKIEGVFIGGDVHDRHYRQAVTAAGFGCMAALDAEKHLASQE